MTDMQQLFDLGKVISAVIAASVLLLSFFAPLFGTYIPYWRRFGRPSLSMTTRLALRLFLASIICYDALFPLNRLLELGLNGPELIVISIPLYVFFPLLMILTWYSHPDGIRGL